MVKSTDEKEAAALCRLWHVSSSSHWWKKFRSL